MAAFLSTLGPRHARAVSPHGGWDRGRCSAEEVRPSLQQ